MYKNPLTDQEKSIVLQHSSHDIRGSLNSLAYIFSGIGRHSGIDSEWGNSNVIHIKNSIASLEQLASEEVSFERVTAADIESRLIQNKKAIKRQNGNITIDVSRLSDFYTRLDVLGLAMYTLMGNSAVKVPHGEGEITVTASDYEGEVSDMVYQNPITPVKGKFKRFRVLDTGPGFPIGEMFDLSPKMQPKQIMHEHFGLKLVAIISKYLMSHFSITPNTDESQKGASISIYHPQDIRSMYQLSKSLG